MKATHNAKGEDRWADQRDLVCRIASICTQVVPDDFGVHLRFINAEVVANDLRMSGVEQTMSKVQPGGSTEIGTNLRKRILEPLVYNKTQMTRPLFISIVTDGVPKGPSGSQETRDTLRDEIIKCQDWLIANDYPPRGNKSSQSHVVSASYSTRAPACAATDLFLPRSRGLPDQSDW